MLPRRKLGELLVERGLINVDQLEAALEKQEKSGNRLGSIMVKMGFIEEEDLLRFLSLYYDVPQVNIRDTVVDESAANMIPVTKAREWNVLPFRLMERPPDAPILFIATPDPTDFDVIDQVKTATGYEVEPFVCTFGSFQDVFTRIYGEQAPIDVVRKLLEDTEDVDVAKALAKVLIKKRIISLNDLAHALEAERQMEKG